MSKIFRYFVYALLFSPIIGYFTYTYFGFLAPQTLSYLIILVFPIFIFTRKGKLKIPGFLYFYFCYIIYMNIWRLYNGYFEDKGLTKYIFNNFHIYSALLIIIIYNVKIEPPQFLKTVTIIKIILIVALVGSLMQLLFDPMLFVRSIGWNTDEGSIYLSRRPSVFTWVSDNDYGISVLAYFSLVLSMDSAGKKNFQVVLFLTIMGIYAILTNGRYVMIGYVLVLTQLLIKQKLRNIFKYIIFISLTIFVGYYIYTNVLLFNLKELAEKRLFVEGDIRNTTRYKAYEIFQKYFPEHPLFGTGVHLTDEIRRVANEGGSSQIHVGYFSHLVSYGILGSFLLFSFWFLLARDLYKKATQSGFYGAFFAFLVFLWANAALVDFSIFYPGILIAIIFSEYYYKNFQQNRFQKPILAETATLQNPALKVT